MRSGTLFMKSDTTHIYYIDIVDLKPFVTKNSGAWPFANIMQMFEEYQVKNETHCR